MQMPIKALAYATAATVALTVGALNASAKVEGNTIILGSALSETGKYSTNGVHIPCSRQNPKILG